MAGMGSSVGASPDPRLVRSVRWWLRAYPRRWRAAHGAELFGLVVDLAAPDARRLGWRSALDLVRGGWATRLRERPPLHIWLGYRLFGRRIPAAFRDWAVDDIDGFWFPVRGFVAAVWWQPLLFYVVLPESFGPMPGWFLPFVALAAVASLVVRPERDRRRARLKHIVLQSGETVVEGAWVTQDVPVARTTARSTLAWAVVLMGAAGVLAVVAVGFAPKVLEMVPVSSVGASGSFELVVAPIGTRWAGAVDLAAALGLGVVGAVVARRRLRRLLGERVDQPFRVVRPLSATGKAQVLFCVAVLAALTWLEVSGRIVLGLSVVLGAVALLALPGAIVALVVARRADDPGLAGRDVWWIATRGRSPAVDDPVPALRPLRCAAT